MLDLDDAFDPDAFDHPGAPPLLPWPPLPATTSQRPPALGQPPPPGPPGPPPTPGRPPPDTASGFPLDSGFPDATGRPPPGRLDLVISWAALTGARDGPATLGRLGPITAGQALPLALTAPLVAHVQWRVIVTDPDGRAIAVERVRRRVRRQAAATDAVVGRITVIVPVTALTDAALTDAALADAALNDASLAEGAWPSPPGSAATVSVRAGRRGIRDAVLRTARRAAGRAQRSATADAAALGGCAHTAASPLYRPPTRIREFVEARDQTCREPTCRQPAWRTDLDHTIPFDQGGLTCACNIGGRCRTHHKIKQEPGWTLTQPRPGHFTITTPTGRRYDSEPDTYPT